MFTEQELADLDALLGTDMFSPVKKAKVRKGKPAVKQPAPVPHLEAPVPVGLVLQVQTRLCLCCKQVDKVILGRFIKYSFKGATVMKPLSDLNSLDVGRLVNTKSGMRETEMTRIEIAECPACTETSVNMWEKLGVFY